MEGGVTDRRESSEDERRLEQAGFQLQVRPSGKRFWQDPESGNIVPGDHAAVLLNRRVAEKLRQAGWEPVEVEGETYWRRPDSGHLYPLQAAQDTEEAQG